MKGSHIPSLDGIRAVAVILVFLSHTSEKPIVPGGFGVTVFFFLSGYLITTLLRREAATTHTISMPDFYLRRAFRILPPMYITLAVAWGIARWGSLPNHGNLLGLVAATFYFYNYADLLHWHAQVPSGMNLLWSLMVEEHFYLIFPWVYAAFLRRGLTRARQARILVLGCLVALLWRCCLVYVFHTPLVEFPKWTYSAADARFDAILFGCILAIWNNPALGDPAPFLGRWKGALALGGLFAILLSLVVREPHFRETLRYTVQSLALYPIFYYCISSAADWQVAWLEWKPLRWLGWVSYSTYLIESCLILLGWHLLPAHHVVVAFVAAVATLIYAGLMRVLVEEPIRRFRSRLEKARRARAAMHLETA